MTLIVKRFEKSDLEGIQILSSIQMSTDFREVVLRPQIAQEEATRLGWFTEVIFVASTVTRRGTLLLNARSLGNSRILLMMSVRRRRQERLT